MLEEKVRVRSKVTAPPLQAADIFGDEIEINFDAEAEWADSLAAGV